jgi:hypothetical protein
MAEDNPSPEGSYADLGGVRTFIPASISPILGHISRFHSEELDSLSKAMEASLERDLAGTRLGDGLSTVMAILRISEDHLKDGELVKGDQDQVRRELYMMAFSLMRGLSRETSR